MEIRICIAEIMKRIDLYNKSRVMGDYQARFCERLRVKLPLPTRRLGRYAQAKKKEKQRLNQLYKQKQNEKNDFICYCIIHYT